MAERRLRIGVGLALAGLGVQAGAALAFGPGAFILTAAVGVPLVLAGALISWRATRVAARPSGDGP